jgi:hypothetical protein
MPRTLLLSVVLLLPLVGCDKATPVAPSGTTLAIAANPSTVSLNGTSTVTVIGRRPNGSPLIPGTEIQFSTNLGSIEPAIATTDSNGQVTAIFRADNRAGAATITASTGTSSSPGPGPTPNPSPTPTTGTSVLTEEATGGVSVTTTIQVGESAGTKPTLIVSASPNSIPVNDTSKVTIIARNADGSPAAGRTVILTTTLGTLSPDRPVTGSDGVATTTFRGGDLSGTATITALVGSSDAATTTITIRDAASDILIDPASITIPSTGGTITFTAFVTNSQGQPFQGATVTFSTNGASGTFEGGSNVAITDTNGSATKAITFSPAQLNGVSSFQVIASTPGPTGTLIRSIATVTVR